MNSNGCPYVHAEPQPNMTVRCPYCDHVTPPAPGAIVTPDTIDWKSRATASEAEAASWKADAAVAHLRVLELVGAVETPGGSATLVRRDYWDGGHRPYRNVWHTPEGPALVLSSLLDDLATRAKIRDGDEFTITVQRTGHRPFGDRRIVLQRPHTYEPETNEQYAARAALKAVSPGIEGYQGEEV